MMPLYEYFEDLQCSAEQAIEENVDLVPDATIFRNIDLKVYTVIQLHICIAVHFNISNNYDH